MQYGNSTDFAMDALVKKYFDLGLRYSEILHCLSLIHRHVISMRTLKRHLRKMGLYRRKFKSDIMEVIEYVLDELKGPGKMHGYKWMHTKCIGRGFVVTQDTVRQLLSILDAEGVATRKARRLRRRMYANPGPDAVWHMDGYDKLSRFGIKIHGCVDGFSRQIIWLKADKTNKDPNVVASFFLEEVVSRGSLCPQRIRADRGTENVHVEHMQCFLRRNHVDAFAAQKSFLYGSSTLNQRIESMWGNVRRQGIQYWMNFFQALIEDGHFDGGYLDEELSRFCFLEQVQVSSLRVLHFIKLLT